MLAILKKVSMQDIADVHQGHPTLGGGLKEVALCSKATPIHH